MKLSISLICVVLLGCCKQPENTSSIVENVLIRAEIPEVEFNMDVVFLNRSNSQWQFKSDSSQVSGYVIESYPNGTLRLKFSVIEGKREGVLRAYFPNGKLKFLENYFDNKLDGEVQRWTIENDYQLIARLNYSSGRLHGEQKKWYSTGELHKLMHMYMGKEEGMQQAFRKNGALYANYEAKNGRVFGLKRSNLCYELDNEKIVYNQ